MSNQNFPVKGDEYYKKLKAGSVGYAGLLFYGDEDYMKANTKRLLLETVCPDETMRDMNVISFDSLDYSPDALSDAFSASPMFAEEKLVILSGMDIDGMRESEFSSMLAAIDSMHEYEGNVFLLYVPAGKLSYQGRAEKLKRLSKLSELLQPVVFEKYTPARLVPWCRMHFAAEGVEAEPELLKRFIAYVSEDMTVLDGEIKKLSAYVRANGRSTFTMQDVERVSASYEEFGAFDLANAILAGDRTTALRIIRKKKEDRTEPLFILAEISNIVYDLIAVRSMIAAGIGRGEMMTLLKLRSEYPLKLRIEAASRFDGETLNRLLTEILDADRKLKSGIGGYGGIEKLVCLF